MLSSRLKAFVIPTSQKSGDHDRRARRSSTSSTRRPAAIAIPAAANWAASFAIGLRCRTSSTSPATKRTPQPARIPASSHDGSTAPTASARATPAASPHGDPDAAERRRGAVVPALAGRVGDEPRRGGGGAQEGPEGERRDRQGGDRDGRFHGGSRVACVPYEVSRVAALGAGPCGRRPTIGARERLRRAPPAPRAVRLALPARPACEVQGVDPRARVDARAAARR